jgi:hypothetical protein
VAHTLKHVRLEGALVQAMDTLSEFYGDNSREDRKWLRKRVVERAVRVDREYLKGIEEMEREIERVGGNLHKVHASCQLAVGLLDQALEKSREWSEKMRELGVERNAILAKEKEIKEFLAAFQLTGQEELVFERDLKGDGVSKEFFGVLRKIQEIRGNCKEMLEKHQQRAM